MAFAKRVNDGVSLLENDVVATEYSKISTSSGEESLNLSGALDILWQIKDKDKSQHTIVQVDSEPFMVEFFEKVQKIKQDMATIRNNIGDISGLHGKILTEVSQQKTKGASTRIEISFSAQANYAAVALKTFT